MYALKFSIVALLATLCWQGCKSPSRDEAVISASSSSFSFRREKLREIDALIETGIAEHRMPGAVVWIEREGTIYRKAYGQRALEPIGEPMTENTIFDAASLTKVIATAPAIMLLVERG